MFVLKLSHIHYKYFLWFKFLHASPSTLYKILLFKDINRNRKRQNMYATYIFYLIPLRESTVLCPNIDILDSANLVILMASCAISFMICKYFWHNYGEMCYVRWMVDNEPNLQVLILLNDFKIKLCNYTNFISW